jgi:hypothetical protein
MQASSAACALRGPSDRRSFVENVAAVEILGFRCGPEGVLGQRTRRCKDRCNGLNLGCIQELWARLATSGVVAASAAALDCRSLLDGADSAEGLRERLWRYE